MMHSRPFCLLLLVLGLLFGPLACAQDPPDSHHDNTTGEIAEISRILDKVESEIARRQALLQAGGRIHADYFRDLVRDYRQAVNDINFARQQNLPAKVSSLQRTERSLALRLWQLDRLRPLMAEVDEEYHSLTRVMRDLKATHSRRIKDDLIAGRFRNLSAKVDEVEHERLQRRLVSERVFYDVRLWDDLLSEQDRQKENQIEDTSHGPMDRLRIPIQRLTRLKWNEGRLAVDRSHWEDLFPPESLANIALEVATELEVRGWKLSSQGHRSFLPENVFHRREPGVVLLFQNLRYAVTQQGKLKIRSNILHDDKGGEFSTDELRPASDSNPELAATHTYSPDEASMWRADVRSTAFKESERSKRQMSERLGRSTVWAALVAIGLLALEGILLGGQAWLSAKQARISEQTAPVAKIEEQRSLISKLEQVFQNEVRPIAILEALNTVRPRGIYFTSTTTDIENHITIEGVAQAINELNSYTDTLKKSGRFVLTSDPKSLTRSGKTSFTVTLAYRPDEAPATTQRSK